MYVDVGVLTWGALVLQILCFRRGPRGHPVWFVASPGTEHTFLWPTEYSADLTSRICSVHNSQVTIELTCMPCRWQERSQKISGFTTPVRALRVQFQIQYPFHQDVGCPLLISVINRFPERTVTRDATMNKHTSKKAEYCNCTSAVQKRHLIQLRSLIP